jgi:hypothetical protein
MAGELEQRWMKANRIARAFQHRALEILCGALRYVE